MRRPRRRRRRGREVRPRPAADRDRLADVEHPARGVAEQVDARVARAARRSRAAAPACARGELPARSRARGPRARAAREAPLGSSAAIASATVPALAHRRGNSAHSTRAQVSASASARWATADLDPERVGEHGQLALALQRQHHPGQRRRAEHRRVGPLADRSRSNAWRSTRRSTARCGRPSRGPASRSASSGSTASGQGAASTIAWVMPVKRWMPAPQRRARAHQRAPAIVQLAAADQHRADLGHLAGVAAEAVGLGVDDQELGAWPRARRADPSRR